MAAFLQASPSSERPAPRPVMASGSQPSSTLATALAVVVLPMPISSVAKRLTSYSLQSFTSSAPARMACSACSRVMAEPFEISPVQHTGLRAKILDAHIHRNQFTIRPPGHSTGVVPSANPQATMAVTSLPV